MEIKTNSMKIDPNLPAYPAYTNGCKVAKEVAQDLMEYSGHAPGMTTRAEIASRLMAGFLASPDTWNVPAEQLVSNAIKVTDALIKELNNTTP